MSEPAVAIPVRSIVQVAYHVPDVEAAARSLAKLYGWGPFFVLHDIELENCTYRGRPAFLDHSAACGQAGPIMVELNQQNGGDYPSVFRDMYSADQTGIQHQATFVDDIDAELRRYEAAGFETAMRARTRAGIEYAFIDTRPLFGYMQEIYRRSDALLRFYGMVRAASIEWDGSDPVRVLSRRRNDGAAARRTRPEKLDPP